MKLELTLVPASSWYTNLRSAMGENWTKLSREIRKRNNYTCQFCGWKETDYSRRNREYSHLHEVWEYDDEKHIQRLMGFEVVCPTCHSVHHWGLSQLRGLDMDKLVYHACVINNCTPAEFREHINKSVEKWNERSDIEWDIDLGEWAKMVHREVADEADTEM